MSLERRIESLHSCELKHKLIEEFLSRQLFERYGWHTERNLFIYDGERILGEIDVLVETPRSYRVYEVKSGTRGFTHGEEQLRRVANHIDYWANDLDKNLHLNLVTYIKKKGFYVRRI